MTPQHRRASDPPEGHGWRVYRNDWRWWLWYGERVWQDFIPLFALAIAFYAVIHLEGESEERRDQTCVVFERDAIAAVKAYEDEVTRLERTEAFIERIPPGTENENLNQEIRRSLPMLREDVDAKWAEAKVAAAPKYCDEEGVGLKEPNPELPDQPR